MKDESRYWLRLASISLLLGAGVFYLALNLALKGGKVVMPNLKGMNGVAAERTLHAAGLRMKVKEERFASGQAPGTVLSQDIEAGVTLKRGRSVELVLSKGAKIVTVPSLVGLASARQARLLLEQNGLLPGVEDQIPSDTVDKDAVVAQSPESGIEVPRDTPVSLLVSLGKPKGAWVMPDLRRSDLAAARLLLRPMSLVLRSVTEKDAPQAVPGSVLSQSLVPGSKVVEGMELNLVVAKGAASQENARLVRIEVPVPADTSAERRVRIVVTDASGQRNVYNAMSKPGLTISMEVRVRGKASYLVNLAGQDQPEKELP